MEWLGVRTNPPNFIVHPLAEVSIDPLIKLADIVCLLIEALSGNPFGLVKTLIVHSHRLHSKANQSSELTVECRSAPYSSVQYFCTRRR